MKLGYRADIDGLRAIAVMGVVLFHASIPGVTGGFVGVDIFFVISGYLITSILINEQDNNGRIDFINFWARRTRRLMPSALLVILATLLVSYLVLTKIDFFYAIRDAVWASIYLINWTKLFSAVQYFDEGGKDGPFLHYWSLAVEEQFYIFLAFVFFIAVAIKKFLLRVSTWSVAKIVIALVVIASIMSFIANIYYIYEAQPIAFFSTPTRIWQLGLGAGIGFIERSNYVPSKRIREFSSWAGLLLMLTANVVLNSNFSYPGMYALLPSIGASLFIFAFINGRDATLPLPSRILSTQLPVAIGKISYSLYLWHWPVFILWQAHYKTWEPVDIVYTMLLTFALSIITYFTVENPIRFSRVLSIRPVSSLVGAVALSLGFVLAGFQVQNVIAGQSLIVLNGGDAFVAEKVRRDLPKIYRSNPACHLAQKDTIMPDCVFAETNSEKSMLIFGDSHMAQWFIPFEKMAAERNMKLYSRTKSACASIDIRQWNQTWKREYTECSVWRSKIMDEIERVKPDIVVLANSSRHGPIDENGDYITGQRKITALKEAELRTIERIRAAGSQVLLIQDTPWHTFDPFVCLEENTGNTNDCRTEISEALRTNSPWSIDGESNVPGVHLLDMNKHFCDEEFCYVANDDHIMVRDKHHVSKMYSEALFEPMLEEVKKLNLFVN